MRGNLTAPLLIRMAAGDEPVTIERLVAATGCEADVVRAALAKFPQLDYDDQGRIAGLFTRSPHWSVAFTFDGRTLYGCASDALVYPVVLGCAGAAEADCPVSGTHIRVELSATEVCDVDPPQAVVSKVRPTGGVTDIPRQVCGLGHFVRSPEAAAGWLALNPQGFVDTVADDFEIHRRGAVELGWAAPSRSECRGG